MSMDDFVTTATHGNLRLRVPGGACVSCKYDLGDLVVSNLLGRGPHQVSFSSYLTLRSAGDEVVEFLRQHELVEVEYTLDLTDYGPLDRTLVVHDCRPLDVSFRESNDGNRIVFILQGDRVSGDLVSWLAGSETKPSDVQRVSEDPRSGYALSMAMAADRRTVAQRLVDAVLSDLGDRSGVLDGIDEEIRHGMRDDLLAVTGNILAGYVLTEVSP